MVAHACNNREAEDCLKFEASLNYMVQGQPKLNSEHKCLPGRCEVISLIPGINKNK